MESYNNMEMEVSADTVNENTENIRRNDENNEEQEVSQDPTISFLTASEMCSMRVNVCKNKSKDEDLELYKGPKLYFPTKSVASEEIVEDILQNNKKFLELQRIAKSRDCMKAEWNEDLKVAIVPYLKGRTTQHMGVNMKGKCALSPEEAIFLLEKALIEVEYNKRPLSVEEAYSVMLKGKLSVEKYEVYSYLSQQGFIVVRHQSRVGPSYKKVVNVSKQKQRKRKADPTGESPEQKRLTFAGVLALNSELNPGNAVIHEESNDGLLNKSEASENVQSISFSLNSDQNMADIHTTTEKVHSETSNDDTISSNFANHTESNVPIEKETSTPCLKEQNIENDNIKISDNVVSSKEEVNMDISSTDKKQNETGKIVEISVKNDNDNNEIHVENANDGEIDVVNANECEIDVENANDDNEIDVENANDDNEIDVINANDDNEIDVENSNDDTNEVIIEDEQRGGKNDDINVEDSCSDYYGNEECVSNESMPVLFEESTERSLDLYSCSPSGRQAGEDLSVETSNLHNKPSKDLDDEVTLVKVMKKEKKPLAVIDLLSDEEELLSFEDRDRAGSPGGQQNKTNGEDVCEESDDDIQVLEVFPGAVNSRAPSRSVNPVKLESRKLKEESTNNVKTQYKPQMKFPDTFRKDIICVPRPPSNLLPLHVQPAKEAYVLNHKKSSQPKQPRLWNSFRDMQDYQRERRLERHMNSFNARSSVPFRDQNDSFNARSSVPFRDQNDSFNARSSVPFRDQNDSFPNQASSFNNPEYSRDIGFDRNQEYQSSRNMFQIMNQERNSLLPTPGFNSPNHNPLTMNIHNLQNLSSSNPAAFVNELQKTVYSVATNMISTILNQHLSPGPPPLPPFSEPNMMGFSSQSHISNFSSGMSGPVGYNSPGRNDFHPMRFPAFSGERHQAPMNNNPYMPESTWRPMNNFRQRNFAPRGPSFPCRYRSVRRKRDWHDVKAAVEGSNQSDSGSDIEEVPINLNQFLYSNDIQPLVKPGVKLPVADVFKALRITQMDSCNPKQYNDRYMPTTPTLEISFDVYLPNSKYKKSEPSIPKYRIVVVRSSDPIPKYSELLYLQRKWNDEATLQIAVVDHGDISFYSFKDITVPDIVPFDS